jgi:alpha-1,2-mannosyltransferase
MPLVLATLVAGILLASTLHRAGPTERTDLPVYLAAAERVLAGENPLGARSKRDWPYIYPPTLAAALTPLTAVSQRVAAGLWFGISLFALVVGVLCVRRALGRDGPFRCIDDGIPLALIGLPAASALLRGQVGPLLLGLLGATALCLARRRDALAGFLIALAAAIKLTPALVLVGLLVARRWRALGASLVGLVLWLVLVPAPFLGVTGALDANEAFAVHMVGGYVRDPLNFQPDPRHPSHVPANQSLAARVIRKIDGPAGWLLFVLLAAFVLGGALLVAGLRLTARAPPTDTVAALGLLMAAPLIVAPVASHHYHVLLLPLLALLVTLRRRIPHATGTLVVFAVLSTVHFAVGPTRELGLLGFGSLILFAAVGRSALRGSSE